MTCSVLKYLELYIVGIFVNADYIIYAHIYKHESRDAIAHTDHL